MSVDPKKTATSPWAFAKRVDHEEEVVFPDLTGTRAVIFIPDDKYRKKVMALGPGHVATAMRRCGIDIRIADCSAWSYDDIEIAKIVIQSGAKIFAMGALYPQFREVERICGIIRSVVPGATIILGGALPTPIPEFVLRKTTADIATIGEAENTIVKVMDALANDKDLDGIPGIAFIRDGEFINNGPPLLARKVTKKSVGWPAWDLYPTEYYITAPKFYPFEQTDRLFPLSTGRGCPYSCNFCFRVSAYRIRPFDEIVEEMSYLVDRYKLNGFYIVDDLLMLSEKKITDFCTAVINRGLKIKFNCSGRVNTVTPEIIRLLKEAGCISIYYGIESGSDHILQTMSKQTNLQQVYEAVRLTREAGIFASYGLMFGQPGENAETLKDTVKLLKNLSWGEYRAQKIFGCVPFPGSGLYDWCKGENLIKDDQDFYNRYICQDWSLDQLPVNMTGIPDQEVTAMFREANRDLSAFYLERMAHDWVKAFGADGTADGDGDQGGKRMTHLFDRIEANESTFDVSGRSG